MEDVAVFVLKFLSRTFDQYKIRVAANAFFEAALFGWCHATGSLEAWHFRPELKGGLWEMAVQRFSSPKSGDFLYLGSYKERISPLLREAMGKANGLSERAPRRVVQALIGDESYPLIGGDEQLAIANQHGFQPYTLLRPRVAGKPQAYMSYLGIELSDENAMVGQARVGSPGMA